jgi:hypothetical protein
VIVPSVYSLVNATDNTQGGSLVRGALFSSVILLLMIVVTVYGFAVLANVQWLRLAGFYGLFCVFFKVIAYFVDMVIYVCFKLRPFYATRTSLLCKSALPDIGAAYFLGMAKEKRCENKVANILYRHYRKLLPLFDFQFSL